MYSHVLDQFIHGIHSHYLQISPNCKCSYLQVAILVNTLCRILHSCHICVWLGGFIIPAHGCKVGDLQAIVDAKTGGHIGPEKFQDADESLSFGALFNTVATPELTVKRCIYLKTERHQIREQLLN